MPIRVSSVIEKTIETDLNFIEPVNVPAATATDVLPDMLNQNFNHPNMEMAGRYIQNVGANPCFYAIGFDCSATQFNGMLAAGGQQLDCGPSGQRVSVFSVLGTTIATTVFQRMDMVTRSRFANA